MSATSTPLPRASLPHRPGGGHRGGRKLTALAGIVQLAGLALVLARGSAWLPALVLVLAGIALGIDVLAPRIRRAFADHRELWLLVALIAAVIAWCAVALTRTSQPGYWIGSREFIPAGPPATNWPWQIGHISLLPLLGAFLAAGAGLVLIADAVRVRIGFTPRQSVPWRDLTDTSERPVDNYWRAAAGVLLVVLAAVLVLGIAGPSASTDPTRAALALIAVGATGAMVVGVPVLVGSRLRFDHELVVSDREHERQRLAAHLHDSVLQTLALVQRQAEDPAAVVRLARRQEHALRAWMAGQSELCSDTLMAGLREAVAAVEDEHAITVELTALGDRPIDAAGEALVAAAREALRNAARHAGGAPVFVFAEMSAESAAVFVRDEGPGFDPGSVPAERRGIRDAITGRMASAGGTAAIDTAPGEGTEVTLTIGAGRSER